MAEHATRKKLEHALDLVESFMRDPDVENIIGREQAEKLEKAIDVIQEVESDMWQGEPR